MSKQLIESVLTIFSMEEVKIETTSERIPEIVLYLKDGSEIRTKIKNHYGFSLSRHQNYIKYTKKRSPLSYYSKKDRKIIP